MAHAEPDSDSLLDRAAEVVRSRFPFVVGRTPLVPLGNRGGFSGARLWRVDSPAGRFCLRAWPPHETLDGIQYRHRLMRCARHQGLPFVPAVFDGNDGTSAVCEAGRWWELTEWLEGRADLIQHPTAGRLEAAATALARLHRAWEPFAEAPAPCPAVHRRLAFLRDWQGLLGSGWRPEAHAADPLRPLVERAWPLLLHRLKEVPQRLEAWTSTNRPVQPCLCDVWHDHLLFEGDRLTGLVDYGAVKPDHVSVDLARMLGSLVGDDPAGWAVGLQAYRRVRPLTADEEGLARVLDRTGTLLGIANWLRWLYHDGRDMEDLSAVRGHLERLLCRVEAWDRGSGALVLPGRYGASDIIP
jgi:homoserine kinase type II